MSGTDPKYRWFHNGELIEGGDGNVLLMTDLNLNDGGQYWVEITNPAGTIRSAIKTLDVVALHGGFRKPEKCAS